MRTSGFAHTPSAGALRERLASERPDLAAFELDQTFAQRPDGSIVVGAARRRGDDIPPFQSEAAFELLLESARALFGPARLRVLERWQGVHASAPDDFLVSSPAPSVRVVSVTSGIGMTTGLGLADRVVDELFATAPGVLTAAGAARSH